ncbi:alpha/beta hydrolase family protein [Compostimonas suwonensis]|uniref:alpha/beta hydrolase family protein n=1 Tax=Compostimonas suwonensis TaxID=1048394 RepID=UPI0012FD1F13|nr:alpha/beta fold hydrolase [Compostimonas suwonensis]
MVRRRSARERAYWRVPRAVGVALAALAGIVGVLALVVAAAASVSVYFARAVVTPPRRRSEDTRVLGIDAGAHEIVLTASADARVPGVYSYWFAQGRGHARVGDILSSQSNRVTRELLGVDSGELAVGVQGRFSGWVYLNPRDLGLPVDDVEIETPLGPAPAWLVPSAEGGDHWVVIVHGRAVTRAEGIRAVPVFREKGYTSLLVSYRNDGDAPSSGDRRYGLGDTEWQDVEAAVDFAVAHGARHVILMGWSMGGAIVLQTVTRSSRMGVVEGLVLESPVIDWVSTLDFQGTGYRLPWLVKESTLELLSHRHGGLATGLAAPIDLKRLDFVSRAGELTLPVLLMHSDDDGYVPSDASRALAAERPDIVTFDPWSVARHTKLWNYDREHWNGSIASWLERFAQGEPERG